MLTRFSLAILFAVLVAASRPVAQGGSRDLLAVGVRFEEPSGVRTLTRTVLATPTEKSLEAFDAMVRSPARDALLQGSTVFAPAPEGGGEGRRILEIVYYGVRTRAGRSPVRFGGEGTPVAGTGLAWEAARDLAGLPPTVTEAAARVLLRSPHDGAFRDAMDALVEVRADVASAEALSVALAPPGPGAPSAARRLIAVQVLRRLGGPAAYPDAFRRLSASDDPLLREAAR